MTVYGRLEKTLAVIEKARNYVPDDVDLRFIVLDDGSPDSTKETLTEFFDITVLDGSGELYWAAGMAAAENAARALPYDYLLWLNNDVDLIGESFAAFVAERRDDSILVGTCCEPDGRTLSYGGMVAVGPSPTQLRPSPASTVISEADTFNGNIVLVPRVIAEALDGIDGAYAHAYADLDYGLRCRSVGRSILVYPGFVGVCPRNDVSRTWMDPAMTRTERLRLLFDRKGLPWPSQVRYVRRFGGRLWPIFLVRSYARPIVAIATGRRVG